jgi:hypothetical protein
MNSIGFIILRHVTNSNNNRYWINCYNCIRKFYTTIPIIIIDDHSSYLIDFIPNDVTIINSEYEKGNAEILPYYYLYHKKFFNIAIILQDSMFINYKFEDFNIQDYKALWSIRSHKSDMIETRQMLEMLDDNELLKVYDNKQWWGVFGATSIINLNFLEKIENRHKFLEKFMAVCVNRRYRCAFERAIGCIFYYNSGSNKNLVGDILRNYVRYGLKYDEYLENKYNVNSYKFIKVWSGR